MCTPLGRGYRSRRSRINKFVKNQCQHLTEVQHNELLKLLQKSEEFFDGTLGTYKTDPVNFELKEYVNPIY